MIFMKNSYFQSVINNTNFKTTLVKTVLVGLLFFITIYPVINTSFTTTDDLTANLKYKQNISYQDIVSERFRSVGRILFLSSSVGFFLSKITDSTYLVVILNSIVLFVNIYFFAFLIGRSLGKDYKYLILLGLVSYIPNAWEHNLLLAYPVTFHLANLLVMISVYIFHISLKIKDKYISLMLILSYSILYILVLNVYEIYLMYIPLFLFIFISHINFKINPGSIFLFTKRLSIILLFLAVYIAFYFFFREKMPNLEYGYTYKGINFFGAAQVLSKYSLSTFPGYMYETYSRTNVIRPISYFLAADKYILFRAIEPTWLVKGALVFLFAYYLFESLKPLKLKKANFGIFIAIYLTFAPNLPISITSKYIDWVVNKGSNHFLTSFFSYYGIILLVMIITAMLVSNVVNKYAKFAMIIVFSFIFSCASVLTDYSNLSIAKQQEKVNISRRLVKSLLNSNVFEEIKNGSAIYAPSFFNNENIVVYESKYWDKYVNATKNKNVNFVSKDQLGEKELDYYAQIIESEQSAYLLWAKVKKSVNFYRLAADELLVFGITESENFNIQGEVDSSQDEMSTSNIFINDDKEVFVGNNFSANGFVNTLTFARIPIKIKSSSPILLDSIEIHPTIFESYNNFDIVFKDGCFNKESDRYHNWVWCSDKATIEIINRKKESVGVTFAANIQACGDASVKIGEITQSIGGSDKEGSDVNIQLNLLPGSNVFKIDAIKGRRCESGADKRNLWIRFLDYYVINT